MVSGFHRCFSPVPPPQVEAAYFQLQVCGNARLRISPAVVSQLVGCDIFHPDAVDAGGGPGEVLVDKVLGESQRLEYLRAEIPLKGRYAHLGHGLEEAFFDGVAEVALRFILVRHVFFYGRQLPNTCQRLECEIGVNRACPVTKQAGNVVYFPGLSRLHDDVGKIA